MNVRANIACLLIVFQFHCNGHAVAATQTNFINFETAPVHPIALSPDRAHLAVCNLPDGKLELFDASGETLQAIASVPVGIDPVSVRFRDNSEIWVVNHISDSISIIDLTGARVVATLDTLDTPSDVVFAGEPVRAFVSCAMPNVIQVFDPITRQALTNLNINAERPKALSVSPDGRRIYAAIFESGNATTVIGAKMRNLLFIENVVSQTNGPYGGLNPPPNSGNDFVPPLNPNLPADLPAPRTSLIVRRTSAGRWLDDNQRDWTEFVAGSNAASTQRVPGWDLADRDLAVVDTTSLAINYATGLMNICMAAEPNPVTGKIAVVGTDARNEVRFEPNLNGVFLQVKLAMINPDDYSKSVTDLNPHLDYSTPRIGSTERDQSIGDPRAIAWSADGSRGYIAGMGSRNIILVDADGARLPLPPIDVGEGPCGLVLDDARGRLYVYHRFASSLSVVDTGARAVKSTVRLFDPTPIEIAAGRRELYDTRLTSGLGQLSCASCHVDARMDRLGWDLGNPSGDGSTSIINAQGTLVTNTYHPMKGVMLTQTLQDIIGHEPFHWRGDRADLEEFTGTFTNLQGATAAPTPGQMRELRAFLASVRFPPNSYRHLDNSLATNVDLAGIVAAGGGELPAGAPLPNGNALRGLSEINRAENFCRTCHTLPTGLGFETAQINGETTTVPEGPNGGHSFPVAFRLENSLRSKIAQFRNMADRLGMDGTSRESRAGFGFGHDGSVDSLPRFLNGLRVATDQDVADITAFLLSVAGSDTRTPGAPGDATPPSGVGRQVTINSPARPAIFDAMLSLARSPSGRVELIAKGLRNGLARGWVYDAGRDLFQSDRRAEVSSPEDLVIQSSPGSEITFTLVAEGTGARLGVDRDADGELDQDELDRGTSPSSPPALVRVAAGQHVVPTGFPLTLNAQFGGLASAIVAFQWMKNGQPIAGETNVSYTRLSVALSDEAEYSVRLVTAFEEWTSAPVHIQVPPALVSIVPDSIQVRPGSNAVFRAEISSLGPVNLQWRFNGFSVSHATNVTLVVSNSQLSAEGSYDVVVENAFGQITSGPASLGLLINPSVVMSPVSVAVPVGGDATFSFTIDGHPAPFGYSLRRSSATLTNYLSNDRVGFLTLHHVQASNAGTYRVIVTNAANPTPGLVMPPVLLTVLADTDGDGLPDEWELANGLEPLDPADALLDADADGLSNRDEYLSGTNPRDADNLLRVEHITLLGNRTAAVIQFQAGAGRTYTVESQDLVGDSAWDKVADVVAFATNRLVSITNGLAPSPTRIYRLVSPRVP